MTTRRTHILATGAWALMAVLPLVAHAQSQENPYKVGILALGSAASSAADVQVLRDELVQLGYSTRRNLVLEFRFANGHSDALPALAADLVRLGMDVIVAISTPAAQAAELATASIPIVMAGGAQPVGPGPAASLAHLGVNVTGVTGATNHPGPQFVVKQLQLLKQASPTISRVAIIKIRDPVEDAAFASMEQAAAQLGVVPIAVALDGLMQADVQQSLARSQPDALVVFPNALNAVHAAAIASFAVAHGLPTMYGGRDDVAAGGLMSYGVNWLDLRRRAAAYVDKILRGASPADLPVEDQSQFEMVVNFKTARALGLTIGISLQLQADEVIQ